jgi:hypothetical protein
VTHTPGFPVKIVGVDKLMPLSSMKAANAAVAWCRVEENPGISLVFREMRDSTDVDR